MDKLTTRPTEPSPEDAPARFQRFNLYDNPFPANPVVNQDSTDKRINGDVYEMEIRSREYERMVRGFLQTPQTDVNHLRLGYIVDTSYIGRGNGKSAFLVNLQQAINREYCLDISNGVNKCFALYLKPEPGGRTKTFASFVDLLFHSMLRAGIVDTCLAILRLEALSRVYPDVPLEVGESDQELKDTVRALNSEEWYKDRQLEYRKIGRAIVENKYLQSLPLTFPILRETQYLRAEPVRQEDFEHTYCEGLRRPAERMEFVFTDLIRLFQAAGFNGAYVLVDDFEQIPSFQSARQRTDFASELRACLFDGLSLNARIGFYNLFLVLHAGVPRLIGEAWEQSGMAHRAPIEPPFAARHVIPFEKLSKAHAVLLLRKYLSEYRIDAAGSDGLAPFTEGAVNVIGEMSEYNAARMLLMAYQLLEKAASTEGQERIDEAFVESAKEELSLDLGRDIPGIQEAASLDLMKKAQDEE